MKSAAAFWTGNSLKNRRYVSFSSAISSCWVLVGSSLAFPGIYRHHSNTRYSSSIVTFSTAPRKFNTASICSALI